MSKMNCSYILITWRHVIFLKPLHYGWQKYVLTINLILERGWEASTNHVMQILVLLTPSPPLLSHLNYKNMCFLCVKFININVYFSICFHIYIFFFWSIKIRLHSNFLRHLYWNPNVKIIYILNYVRFVFSSFTFSRFLRLLHVLNRTHGLIMVAALPVSLFFPESHKKKKHYSDHTSVSMVYRSFITGFWLLDSSLA